MAKEVRNFYELVPRQMHPFEECPDGTVEVLLPRYGEGFAGRILKYVFSDKPVRVHLDDIGTSVWRLCDGESSVHSIGQTLQSQFGERIEPVYDRLHTFLEQMRTAGLIAWKN